MITRKRTARTASRQAVPKQPTRGRGGTAVVLQIHVTPQNGRARRPVSACWSDGTEVHRDSINPTLAADRRRFAKEIGRKTGAGDAQRAWIEDQIVASADKADRELAEQVDAARMEQALEFGIRPAYEETPDGFVWNRPTPSGVVQVPLTNFQAEITAQIEQDDAVEIRRAFEITARHEGREQQFSVSATKFESLNWVPEHLGAKAIVWPPYSLRDHARAAIQLCSKNVATRRVYTHLGWRLIDGQWVFLHAGGAIGTVGTVSGIEVSLAGSLVRFEFSAPPEGKELEIAVRASLCLLEVDESVLVPVLGAYRAVLGAADLAIQLVGETGVGKSERAALAQQHFGAGMDRLHLPGNWSSTGNSLEMLAFGAKDALLVVDDFAPSGTMGDVDRCNREAGRVLRAQGNQSGRGRLTSDGTLRPQKAPRGLILCTGEDVPRGHSIRARSVIVTCERPDQSWWQKLKTYQRLAAEGVYAKAMSGFLQWLADEFGDEQALRQRRVAELRDRFGSEGSLHKRTPAAIAELLYGLERFVKFAVDCAAIPDTEAARILERCEQRLLAVAATQVEHHVAADSAVRFMQLIRAAIVSGRAHVAGAHRDHPVEADVWGWRERCFGTGDNLRSEWVPNGDCIGWVDGSDLFLQPDVAYRIAVQVDTGGESGITVNRTTLWKRLRDRGFLVSTDEERQRLTVRRNLQNARRDVLHVRADHVMPPPESQQPSQPSQVSQ